MTLHVIFKPQAEADLEEAYRWYEAQAAGLGQEFIRTVDACLAGVARQPESYPVVYKQVRRALIRRFPYSIFYLIEPERIIVVACFHAKREPRRWQLRV